MDKIICVGKNYLDHAQEMPDKIPEQPVIFLKPSSVLKTVSSWNSTTSLMLPKTQDEIHYECELVLQINVSGYQLKNLTLAQAFSGVTLGLDMTNRTQQSIAKAQSGPWTTGKVFPDAAIIGPWLNLNELDLGNLPFSFALNGLTKQQGNSKDMRMGPLGLLHYISEFFPVCRGDLLFTGTPKGIGPVKAGDIGKLSLSPQHSYIVQWI
jgi:2-keto-4-pentenoate hydratase/2-oxohepta-3-ene-1,7-dioic acid hydratase in catechol pathway